MSLGCLFGHKWNGCRCTRCGTVRDESHAFVLVPGKCEERCAVCGQARPVGHRWAGCRCGHCGEIRDEGHDYRWVPGEREARCRICGKAVDAGEIPLSQLVGSLREETDPDLLRQAALEPDLDCILRRIAVTKLQDPGLSETVLMEKAAGEPSETLKTARRELYESAAGVLSDSGEQQRLEKVFRHCGNHGIQAIVISKIRDPALLEEAAVNRGGIYGAWYEGVSENALRQISDETVLARIALSAAGGDAAREAAGRIAGEDTLRRIVLEGRDISARIEAVRRLPDAGSVRGPLKRELAPKILDNPLDSRQEITLLDLSGDKTGRVLALCTGSDGGIPGPHVETAEALEADPDILYPVAKKLLTELAGRTEDHAGEMRLIPVIGGCIRLLHDSGILAEQIETDFPRTVSYRYSYTGYAGDGYEGRYTGEKSGEAAVW